MKPMLSLTRWSGQSWPPLHDQHAVRYEAQRFSVRAKRILELRGVVGRQEVAQVEPWIYLSGKVAPFAYVFRHLPATWFRSVRSMGVPFALALADEARSITGLCHPPPS